MRSFWFVCVIAVLTLSLSACGGGEKKTAHTPDDAEMSEMVMITSEGLPWPVSLISDEAESNEDAANEYPDPENWLKNYEEWGRTGGHSASFQPEGEGVSFVETDVEYYPSIEGAKSAWSADRDFVTSEVTLQRLAAAGITDAKIEEVDADKVGDQSAAFRIFLTAGGEPEETLIVLFRREGVEALASVRGEEGSASVKDAIAVAKQLDARIKDILYR